MYLNCLYVYLFPIKKYQGDGHQALITLQKGVEEHFSDSKRLAIDNKEEAQAQKFAHAKVRI